MLNIDVARNELNKVLVGFVEETIKIADKYGFNRNELLRASAEKVDIMANVSDFTNYECRGNGGVK